MWFDLGKHSGTNFGEDTGKRRRRNLVSGKTGWQFEIPSRDPLANKTLLCSNEFPVAASKNLCPIWAFARQPITMRLRSIHPGSFAKVVQLRLSSADIVFAVGAHLGGLANDIH